MPNLLRSVLPLVVILAVPLVPLLIVGDHVETTLDAWKASPPPPGVVALTVVGLLASDLFLPIPSSLVGTLAGWQLGAWGGAVAVWTGMTLGAVLGFVLGRLFGQPLVGWLTRDSDLARTRILSERFGPLILVLGRGVPVLAEATVLLVGMHRLSWHRFLPPVLLSNLGLAVAYAAFGHLAERYQWLPQALAISIVLPVAFIGVFRLTPPDGE